MDRSHYDSTELYSVRSELKTWARWLSNVFELIPAERENGRDISFAPFLVAVGSEETGNSDPINVKPAYSYRRTGPHRHYVALLSQVKSNGAYNRLTIFAYSV